MVPAEDEVTSLSAIGEDAHHGPAAFTTTHWSVVLEAQDQSPAAQEAALEKPFRTYWRPIYYFVRRQGARTEDAEDLTQGFFALLLVNTVSNEKDDFVPTCLDAFHRFLNFKIRSRISRRNTLRSTSLSALNPFKPAISATVLA